MEALLRAQQLLSQQFEDAPQFLSATITLAMNAVQRGNKGEALSELRKADTLVKEKGLQEWEAEMFAAWAVFYFYMKEERNMYQAIRKAQQREPDNQRIGELRELLKSSPS